MLKNCEICGGKFAAARRTVKYCSDVCRKEGNRRNAAERSRSPYDKTEKEKRPDRIAEINKLAREAGLSYGQYVAKQYQEEQKRRTR